MTIFVLPHYHALSATTCIAFCFILRLRGGKPYIFHYGNVLRKVRRGNRTITTFQISGSQQALLCSNCVFAFAMTARSTGFLQAAIALLVIAVIVGIIALVVDDSILSDLFGLAFVLVLAYTLSLFIMSFVEKKRAENQDFALLSASQREESGSKIAINLCKPALQAKGFKEFFTPNRLKQLRRPSSRRQ